MIRKALLFGLTMTFWSAIQAATLTFIGGIGFWDDPANWDLGVLPAAADHVIIPAGQKVGIPGGFAAFAESMEVEGGLFVLGTLTVNGSAGHGILFDGGRLDNRGTIIINNSSLDGIHAVNGSRLKCRTNGSVTVNSTGDDGIELAGNSIMLHQGLVEVRGPNPDDGFVCGGTLLVGPSATLSVENSTDDGFEITGRFENYGYMVASNGIGDDGMLINSTQTSINRSDATMEFKQAGDKSVYVFDGTLVNELNALIEAYDYGWASGFGAGVFVGSVGTTAVFHNFGKALFRDAANGVANGVHVYSNGLVINEGSSLIQNLNLSGSGAFIVSTGELRNLNGAQFVIEDVEMHGISSQGIVENSGTIEGDGMGERGLTFNATSSLDNSGTIRMLNVGLNFVPASDQGFLLAGPATNHDCADLDTDDQVLISGNFVNNGFLRFKGDAQGSATGVITNNGVIGDYDDELSSYIGTLVNNAVIAREIAGPMTVGVLHPNFLELGSLAGHTVNGVYTDETFTTFAGAYSVVSNAFNPAPVAVGLTKLYLRISDTAPICSRTVEISVPGGISLTGDPLEKELSTPTAAALNLFPNPSTGLFIIQLPERWFDQQVDIRVIDLRGQPVRTLSSVQTTQQVLEFPDAVPPGIYFVQTFLNGALKQVEQVILER